MKNIMTVREATHRAKADGLPISEYTLRCWIKQGAVPARKVGTKALIFYPNLVSFLQCADGSDNAPAAETAHGIRRVDV